MGDIRLARWLRLSIVTVLVAAIGLQAWTLRGRLTNLPVYRSMYPVDAFAYMNDERIHGKLLVAFNWAQYAISALAPDVTVAFDGRFDTCYPKHIIDMHFDFLLGEHKGYRHRAPESGPLDSMKALEYGEPDLVLIERKYDDATAAVRKAAAAEGRPWVLLYQDHLAELWGKAARYDDPAQPTYVDPARRIIGDHESKTYVQWPALPAGRSLVLAKPGAPAEVAAVRRAE